MANRSYALQRRDFLKGIGLGLIGAAAGGGRSSLWARPNSAPPVHPFPSGRLYTKVTAPARVSLVKGNDRREIVFQSLKKIEDEILAAIGDKPILLKPNVVLADNPLAVTHVNTLRAILDFLAPHYRKQIVIGEAGVHNTFEGYRNYGYLALEKEYNVKLVDLNRDSFQYRYVFGKENRPVPIRIIATFLDPGLFIISAAPMKTHNYVLVTLSLKNVLLASPLNEYGKQNDKGFMHLAPPAVNDLCHYNMFHIAREVFPDLAVIDGFEGMEGDGPAWGTAISSRVALASLDPLAADITAARLMGFDPKRVNYLTAMAEAGMGQGEIEKIQLLGASFEQCFCKYKPNKKMAELYQL